MKNYQKITALVLYISAMLFGAMVQGRADNLFIAVVFVHNTILLWATIGGFEIGKDSQ